VSWHKFDYGKTVGQEGPEGGKILLDEEHELDARITFEKAGSFFKRHFAITCGIYGWMMHTHFISSNNEALKDFEAMKGELDRIMNLVPTIEKASDDNMSCVTDEISKFVNEFV
jgi:hypothetical protein